MNADHYTTLGVDRHARQEEVQAAFDELLASRRSRRQRTSDLHQAIAVLGDVTLRRAYDATLFGQAASDKLAVVKGAVVEAVPDIDWAEVREHTWQSALRVTVLASGATAKAADATAGAARKLQAEAAKRINKREE